MDSLSLDQLCFKLEALAAAKGLEKRGARGPRPRLSMAQMACVCIAKAWFQVPSWKAFFDNPLIQKGWREMGGFELGSYGRFMLRLTHVQVLLETWVKDHHVAWSGFGAIDSTLVAAGRSWCRYDRSKYKALRRQGAGCGYGSTGPCFGVKLHLAVDASGHIHNSCLTSAAAHDLAPVKAGFLDNALGIVLGDSGYVGRKEQQRLARQSVGLWARPPKHHEAVFSPVQARLYRWREVAEGVFAKLKDRFGLVPHWPPRTLTTLRAHIYGSLAAYLLCPRKPQMRWSFREFREQSW
jgi:hypothetical protein